MQMLSALDATFIYLESEHSPMAIGAVYVIDAKDAPPDFCYQKWCSLVESRLQYSKVFRERLIEVPWDLSFHIGSGILISILMGICPTSHCLSQVV